MLYLCNRISSYYILQSSLGCAYFVQMLCGLVRKKGGLPYGADDSGGSKRMETQAEDPLLRVSLLLRHVFESLSRLPDREVVMPESPSFSRLPAKMNPAEGTPLPELHAYIAWSSFFSYKKTQQNNLLELNASGIAGFSRSHALRGNEVQI